MSLSFLDKFFFCEQVVINQKKYQNIFFTILSEQGELAELDFSYHGQYKQLGVIYDF